MLPRRAPRLALAMLGLALSLPMLTALGSGRARAGDEPAPHAKPVVAAMDEDEDEAVACRLEIQALPAALRYSGSYTLEFSDRLPVPLPAEGELALELTAPVSVSLIGPAYEGTVELTPAACANARSLVLVAQPRPARLLFRAGVPLSELIINCLEGCPYRWRAASRFPDIAFAPDKTEVVVKLEFKAMGYRARRESFKLTPGDNTLFIALERLP